MGHSRVTSISIQLRKSRPPRVTECCSVLTNKMQWMSKNSVFVKNVNDLEWFMLHASYITKRFVVFRLLWARHITLAAVQWVTSLECTTVHTTGLCWGRCRSIRIRHVRTLLKHRIILPRNTQQFAFTVEQTKMLSKVTWLLVRNQHCFVTKPKVFTQKHKLITPSSTSMSTKDC